MQGHDYRAMLCHFTALLFLAVAFGCADDGKVDIAGQVTLEGDPITKGTISFFPKDNQGASAEAVIQDGAYSVTMPKGEKRVVIRGFKKVGERFPWGKDNPPADILEEIVPKQFNDDSKLSLSADADDGAANFDLTGK